MEEAGGLCKQEEDQCQHGCCTPIENINKINGWAKITLFIENQGASSCERNT